MTASESAELSTSLTSGGGRPARYKTKAGIVVPGVTSILGAFKDPGALMHWAWKLGTEGVDFRKARDDAGGVGHHAHALIHASIHKQAAPTVPRGMSHEDEERALQAFRSFCEWRDQKHVIYLDTERPLVSELHLFGGTYDLLASMGTGVNGNPRMVIVDYKSGNRIYREHVAQLAAYAQLLRETRGVVVDGAVALRIGKEHGTFSDHFFPPSVLEIGWQRFLASKWLYETDKELGKAANL